MELEKNLYTIQNYYIVDEKMFGSIINNINYNYLLILFTMTCVCGLVSSIKKPNKDYLLIQNAEPLKGEIINKV
jgi:hypothetical protein